MSALGLEEGEWKVRPAMLPDFNFWIAPTKRDAFQSSLDQLRVVGKRVNYKADGDGFFNVCLGHPNLYKQPPVAQLGDRAIDFKDIGLDNVEIEDRSGSSAYHIPQGCLVVYDPARLQTTSRPRISTVEIAPALLNNFSVPVPSYMKPGSLAL
jgi:hypothetical protein